MTIENALQQYLFNSGMFENQAQEVVEMMKRDEIHKDVKWDVPEDYYPPQFMNLLFFGIKKYALEWIDKNCPQAWYRAVFVSPSQIPAQRGKGD